MSPRHRHLVAVSATGVVLVAVFVLAGSWQLARYQERVDANERIQVALSGAPMAIDIERARADDEWRSLTVSGTYDAEGQVLLRLREQDGIRGAHVLTPLRSNAGPVVLVDRGFLESSGSVADLPPPPAPPTGPVTVLGRLRLAETAGGASFDAETGSVRAVDLADLSDLLAPRIGDELAPVWVELVEQTPAADETLAPIPAPSMSSGRSLVYAVQWWLFAAVAVVGTIILLRRDPEDDVSESLNPLSSSGPGPEAPGRSVP